MERERLERYFKESTEPVFLVVDEEGVNMANAKVRQTEIGWVYVDEVDGWDLLDDVEGLILILAND